MDSPVPVVVRQAAQAVVVTAPAEWVGRLVALRDLRAAQAPDPARTQVAACLVLAEQAVVDRPAVKLVVAASLAVVVSPEAVVRSVAVVAATAAAR